MLWPNFEIFIMTIVSINSEKPFGKYQRYFTIGILSCYQLLMVPWGLFLFYSLVTLNWNVFIICAIICAFQYPFKKSETFIKFVKKYVQPTKYFKKFTRIFEEKLDPNEKTLYCYHPHSIFSYTLLLNMNWGQKDIPDFIGLGSRAGFNVPILGLILRLWGCSTVCNQNIKKLMIKGKPLALVPGGFEEATLTTLNQMRFYLKNRKGFVKYALKYGYTMRPVVCIGQNKAFETFDGMKSLRLFLNKFKLPASFFINRKYLFLVDPNIEVTTIVGKGIKGENEDPNYDPSVEEIEKYHQLYVQEISRIYNKYRSLNDDKPLVIF